MTTQDAFARITGIKANRIADTKQLSREQWLKLRRLGIGGSDIGALCGLNPFKSPIDVYLDKTGLAPDLPQNERMKWGQILEEPVAGEFAKRANRTVMRINAVLQHPEHPIALANLDRYITRAKPDTTSPYPFPADPGILEVKTTGWAKAWANGQYPEFYWAQVMWYMGISNLRWTSFATLISGQDLLIPDQHIEFDQDAFEKMLTIAERFWRDHVEKHVPPPPSQSDSDLDAVKALYPNKTATTITLSDDLQPLIDRRGDIDHTIKQLTSQKKQIDAQILFHIGENAAGLTSTTKITRVVKSGRKIQERLLKEHEPAIYNRYAKEYQSIYPLFSQRKDV